MTTILIFNHRIYIITTIWTFNQRIYIIVVFFSNEDILFLIVEFFSNEDVTNWQKNTAFSALTDINKNIASNILKYVLFFYILLTSWSKDVRIRKELCICIWAFKKYNFTFSLQPFAIVLCCFKQNGESMRVIRGLRRIVLFSVEGMIWFVWLAEPRPIIVNFFFPNILL